MRKNHLFHILEAYEAGDRSEPWFLATVVHKQGSSYRHPGALMLVSPRGQTFGMVSGGCLEADVVRRARMVDHMNRSEYVVYDSAEEGNIAAELGLGCNGRIGVFIQRLDEPQERVILALLDELRQGRRATLVQCYQSSIDDNLQHLSLLDESNAVLAGSKTDLEVPFTSGSSDCAHLDLEEGGSSWSISAYRSPISLWVIGGGQDAEPVVRLAALMGWQVTLVDHRLRYAREGDFPDANVILRENPDEYRGEFCADAVVVMSHNLDMDVSWIKRLSKNVDAFQYIGVLGPRSRMEEILESANIAADSDFRCLLHGPMGLDLGGDLPESIALSVIAQIHAVISGKNSTLNSERSLSA